MKTKLNFISRYHSSGKVNNGNTAKYITAALPLVIIIAAFTTCGIIMQNNRSELRDKLAQLLDYTTYDTNIAQRDEVLKYIDDNASLTAKNKADSAMKSAILSYPLPSSSVTDEIVRIGSETKISVVINSYYASAGEFSFTAKSESAEYINSFIENLRASVLFASVKYSGYSYSEADKSYTVNVVCALADNAGRVG